jgi:hypothetical protein
VYGILDALGDYGGVQALVEAIIAFLIAPISSHVFFMKAILKLYSVKTEDHTLFYDDDDKIDKAKVGTSIE